MIILIFTLSIAAYFIICYVTKNYEPSFVKALLAIAALMSLMFMFIFGCSIVIYEGNYDDTISNYNENITNLGLNIDKIKNAIDTTDDETTKDVLYNALANDMIKKSTTESILKKELSAKSDNNSYKWLLYFGTK